MSWESIHRWCTRWLPIIGGVIVILGALFGGIKYVVSSEVAGLVTSVQNLDTTLKPLPEAVNSLKDRATKMETHWEDLKIRDLSQRPTSKEGIDAIKKALAEAKDANIKLSTETIQESGTRFLLAADKNRAA